jgi:rhodanese-related sulfurtransferase
MSGKNRGAIATVRAMAEQETTEQELTPAQVAELGEVQLVDVRTTAEYEAGHLAGARHVPLDQIPSVAAELDTGQPLVFYCRVGERSALAAEAFRGAGFEAYTMAGGLIAWAEDGRPLEPENGEVAAHSSIPDF